MLYNTIGRHILPVVSDLKLGAGITCCCQYIGQAMVASPDILYALGACTYIVAIAIMNLAMV